jgi:hypothetical protein
MSDISSLLLLGRQKSDRCGPLLTAFSTQGAINTGVNTARSNVQGSSKRIQNRLMHHLR